MMMETKWTSKKEKWKERKEERKEKETVRRKKILRKANEKEDKRKKGMNGKQTDAVAHLLRGQNCSFVLYRGLKE